MVNVALLVVAGATFLNSISVILLAVYARKKEKEIRKLNVALKTIASELPEEERTPEVIENVIIPKIKEKLNESCIRL